jgi:hypothetical protein
MSRRPRAARNRFFHEEFGKFPFCKKADGCSDQKDQESASRERSPDLEQKREESEQESSAEPG